MKLDYNTMNMFRTYVKVGYYRGIAYMSYFTKGKFLLPLLGISYLSLDHFASGGSWIFNKSRDVVSFKLKMKLFNFSKWCSSRSLKVTLESPIYISQSSIFPWGYFNSYLNLNLIRSLLEMIVYSLLNYEVWH